LVKLTFSFLDYDFSLIWLSFNSAAFFIDPKSSFFFFVDFICCFWYLSVMSTKPSSRGSFVSSFGFFATNFFKFSPNLNAYFFFSD